jgi:hypothetical protein
LGAGTRRKKENGARARIDPVRNEQGNGGGFRRLSVPSLAPSSAPQSSEERAMAGAMEGQRGQGGWWVDGQ